MKTKFTILLFLLLSFQIGKSQFTVNLFNITFCHGQGIQMYYSSNSPAISWQWDFGDGITSALENPIHYYSNPGTYIVTLIASNGVDSDDDVCTITVIPLPIVDFTYTISGDTVQFIDQSSSDAMLWNWDFGNGITSNYVHPTTTYPYPPDSCYDVTLTVTNNYGCVDSLTKPICITSIEELGDKNITIYPSPIINNQKLTIKGNLNGVEKIIGHDVLGNLISFPIISKNENEIIFETNQLNQGVYFLQLLFDNKKIITKKIVVQ